jgi:hypothetical protein
VVLEVQQNIPKAAPCPACRDDRHDSCGGVESGCGCAAANHFTSEVYVEGDFMPGVPEPYRENVRIEVKKK